jgi:putative ABC transport system permease protein
MSSVSLFFLITYANSCAMIKSYLKIALRNMWRYKGYTLINTLGLTIGIAVSLLILMWIKDELSYDRFHTKSNRIYRVLWEARFGDNEWKIPLGPVPVAETLEREFPEVAATTQLYLGGLTLEKGAEYLREQKVLFTDDHFSDIFTVEFLSGDPQSALANPDALVLTASTAERYFGEEDPIGKTLEQKEGKLWRVTGVVADFPRQSHLQFDFLAPLQALPHIEYRRNQWGAAAVYSYFLLNSESSITALDAKFRAYVDENVVDDDFRQGNNYTRFPFQALTDIHLHSNLEYELRANGNIQYVYIFGSVALMILLLACINFINLATARSITRAREVGVRKVLGSGRLQIRLQFFSETFFQVALSVVAAVLIVELTLPYFNDFAGKKLDISFPGAVSFWGLLAGLTLMTTLTAGSLPAFFLSGFRPVKVLKGEVFKFGKRHLLRESLVVFQFTLSVCLIVGTLVVKNQLHFLQEQRLGFDKERILTLNRAQALGDQYSSFLESLQSVPGVKKASATQALPGKEFDSTVFLPEQPANYQQTSLSYSAVDPNFVEVLGLELSEGRNFSPDMTTDSVAYLINEAAVDKLGWAETIGKKLSYGGSRTGPVIGVVKDFHFRSLHHEVEPVVLMLSSWNLPYIAIKLQAGDLNKNINDIKAVWDRFSGNAPFEYFFLDEAFQQLYAGEQRMAGLFTVFSLLAMLIAGLGLFGLASFLTVQRRKEIGIRKVLGASVESVVGLLSRDFLRLVFLSIVIAVPLAWWLMDRWLLDFAYRIALQWQHFAVAAMIAVLVGFLSVSVQSIRAAAANPADTIGCE